MLSHVTVGITDIDRAVAFYRPLMEALGWEEAFATRNPPGPWAGWKPPGAERPLFIVTMPFDREAPAAPGNGPMLAFTVPSRGEVEEIFALALDIGGTDAGAAALPPPAHAAAGACFRDPFGNRLCLVSTEADEVSPR